MKKFLAALLAATMVLGLTACGSSAPAPAAPAADASAKSEAPAAEAPAAEADGTVYTFNIDYPNPESSVGFRALSAWADYLREESNGRLDMQIFSGGALGALPDCVSNCESGVTDGFWSGVTIYPGVFPLTEVFGLPMIGAKNYQVINDALNDMLATYQPMADEWSNFKVVTLHSSSISPILFAKGKGVEKIQDMKGLNLRISNAYSTEWFTQLGANPTSCGINDGYENIQKGVIDGGLFFYDKVESSALYEVIDALYHGMTIYPLNMLCLNIDKYNELPDDLKALIDESGKVFLDASILGFDEQEAAMLDLCEKEYGVKIIREDDDSIAWLTENAQTAKDLWIKTMNDNGLDGQECYDKAVELIEKYNANY